MTINLEISTTRDPDLGGSKFYVECGQSFDLQVFADAYGIRGSDIDDSDIDQANDAASCLTRGEWLEVSLARPTE